MDSNNQQIDIESLPLPAFIVSKKDAKVVYANTQAAKCGVVCGDVFADSSGESPPSDQLMNAARELITLKIGNQPCSAEITASDIDYDGMPALLVIVTRTEQDGGLGAVTTGICQLFMDDKTEPLNAFLDMTAQHAGAFYAAAYEKNNGGRYIIKGEWRQRKSVCIPILSADFDAQPQTEMDRLVRLKRAADAVKLPFTKEHGTQGLFMYFFDTQADKQMTMQLEKYAALYKTLAKDVQKNEKLMKKSLEALSYGLAIWDSASLKLIFENKAYREMFGKDNARMVSERIRTDLRAGMQRSTEYTDIAGRSFAITHTAVRHLRHTAVATLITDITKYKQAEKKLEQIAKTDVLTGLMNRRAGLEELIRVYADCKKQHLPLTVCFADIDGLKRINDTCGHGMGDDLIRAAADVLKNFVSDIGCVCRLGGDEFVLILPGMSAAKAKLLAAQMQRAIEKFAVSGQGEISMSFGFVQAGYGPDETPETLISIADTDMYREKRKKVR